MAEQLKDVYSEELLLGFGKKVQAVYHAFKTDAFLAAVMDSTWESLALKTRMRRVSEQLGIYLPSRYEDALDILFAVSNGCTGLPYLFFSDFVALFGQDERHWQLSMRALESFTQLCSSEFAIRPFLLREPKRAMRQMAAWAGHPNEHVRRLASEGCRPRLPWGEALPMFKKDPAPVLRVLELLKADASLYVRKSVANNLNDIAKDNPAIVIETARRWQGNNKHTDWIIRQGCRTLIRKANPDAMALFDYDGETQLATNASISVQPAALAIGESCEIGYAVNIRQGQPAHVRIEYGVDFIKSNGRTSRKSFLLSDKTVPGGARLTGTRTHDWSDLTTRRHYPGQHKIVLLVNGREAAHAMLTLKE